jgi:phospholipid/cholesterol/gamma-HCH transport system substrate-binding protein
MRGSPRVTFAKFGTFALVMVMLTASLFFIFGQYRTGTTNNYSAIFADVSRLKSGDSVRAAGIRVGTVNGIKLRKDKTVVVNFDADRRVALTTGTRAAVRYLNLVGDRYLELIDGPGSSRLLSAGARIPPDHTAPALDLDLLLGGLKPVIQGLNPKDINALTSSLVQVFQGEGPTMDSIFSKTSSFSNAMADNNRTIQQLIDNLHTVLATLVTEKDKFSGAIDRLQRLTTELSQERDPIATAIESLEKGTASIAELLTKTRRPLAGTVNQVNQLAPLLDQDKDRLDAALQKAPENFRKLARLGAYGSFIQFYVCGMSVRVSDLQGRTAVFPWLKTTAGRCAEPNA